MIKFIHKLVTFTKLRSAIKNHCKYAKQVDWELVCRNLYDPHATRDKITDGLIRANYNINRLKLDLVGLGVSHKKIDKFITCVEKGVR